MPNDTTTRDYPLPHPDNIAREDAARVRASIERISSDITDLEERNVIASETEAGSVRLATAAEATAGSVTTAVPTIKRAKDMITSALSAIQGAMDALVAQMTEQLSDNEAEVDQAIDDLQTAVNGQLAGFNTTLNNALGSKFDKAGGIVTGDVTVKKSAPTFILDSTGNAMYVRSRNVGKDRWVIQMGDPSAETGGNAGSNFSLLRYNDAGALIDVPFKINRATAAVEIAGSVSAGRIAAANDIQTHRNNNTGAVFFGNAGVANIFYDGANFTTNAWLFSPRGARHADTADLGGYATLGQMNNFVVHCRFVHAGDAQAQWTQTGIEIGSACLTSAATNVDNSGSVGLWMRFRYLQYYIPNIGYASFVWN